MTAARLLAHDIAILRDHDESRVEIDHDPSHGRLQLRYATSQDDEIELTLEPERTAPRDDVTGGKRAGARRTGPAAGSMSRFVL